MSEMYTKHAVKYVIDMGCGSGIYAEWFIKHSVNSLKCMDISEDMVSLVKDTFGAQVHAYTQDISQGLPLESDNSADVIICPLVLHYVEDLAPVFNDVQRVLKEGGYMVFSTHHPFADFECSKSGNYFEREWVEEEWNTVGTPVKVSFYRRSLTEICHAITASGLSISQISEGNVDEQAKAISASTYNHLKNNPNFIFIRCEKARTSQTK